LSSWASSTVCSAVFEVDEGSGKIRCKECFEADPINTGWITQGSAARHIDQSREHGTNIENNQRRHSLQAIQERRLHEAYSAAGYANLDSNYQVPGPSIRPDFDDPMLDNFVSEDDNIFSAVDNTIIPADIHPLTGYNSAHERERLRRQVELLMMQAEQDDEFMPDGLEDDTTVTNVTENIQFLG
jgi:hypothetical protein